MVNKKKYTAIAVFLLLFLSIFAGTLHAQTSVISNYAIHSQQDFNQPQFYPLNQTASANLYQPVGNWVGRLILPQPQEIKAGTDWVWFEVQHAPESGQNLVGKVVRLEWKNQKEVQSYVQAVTRDVNFTPATKISDRQGNIHPQRLDGRKQVGPLQSLAGARPNDDVVVILDDVTLDGESVLQIEKEPILATGRYYGLVKIRASRSPIYLFGG